MKEIGLHVFSGTEHNKMFKKGSSMEVMRTPTKNMEANFFHADDQFLSC